MPRKKKQSKLKLKMLKFPVKKLGILGLIIVLATTIFLFRDMIFCNYPIIVMQYKMRYSQMLTSEYLEQLRTYTRDTLNDSIDGLNWTQLLEWEHKYLMYWSGSLQIRPELPIDILTVNQIGNVTLTDGRTFWACFCSQTGQVTVYGEITNEEFATAKWTPLNKTVGRCGEFALLFNGLLLANGYRSRIVVDCSIKTDNRSAGDHVWNEVWINNTWIHVDPTVNKIDDPYMYADANRWNKNVNLVYAITNEEIVNVTEDYKQ